MTSRYKLDPKLVNLGLYMPASLKPHVDLPKKPRKKSTFEESVMQQHFVRWLHLKYPYVVKTSFAVPNTARRSLQEGSRFKREGVKAGVSDFIILYPSSGYHGMLIEFKTAKGKMTPEQTEFQDNVRKANYYAITCRSLDIAMAEVTGYINPTQKEGLPLDQMKRH